MSHVEDAFDQTVQNPEVAQNHYLCLLQKFTYYGGPEEGGWYGTDHTLVKYKMFNTKEQAEQAQNKVNELAEQLSREARKEFGQHCLNEIEWCENRGLEPDFLPEPDGPDEFYTVVADHIPQNSYGPRHYE